mmetsp:Transcript_16996/g.25512  ORF Transcript_16996/g.25512 Transcript_16996/m.25512 type:complete len:298 (+) Transcript_16996:112-1005(+)
MSQSIIEHTRQVHSDLEKLQEAMIDDILSEKKNASHKELILRDHRMKSYLDQTVGTYRKLVKLYEDESGTRKKELATITGSNVFAEFNARLKATTDYHRKFPGASVKLDGGIPVPKVNAGFTGEENYAKYVDMHELYKRYTNMKIFEKCNYFSYLGKCYKLHNIPKQKKIASREYQTYVQDLYNYIYSFFQKRHPLADASDFKRQIDEEFEKLWKEKKLDGWKPEVAEDEEDDQAIEYGPIDLSKCSSWEALEPFGMEYLKSELKRVGLKTGFSYLINKCLFDNNWKFLQGDFKREM